MCKYTVTCKECKHKRTYEAENFRACMQLAYDDGWAPTGTMTYRVCKECAT